MHGAWDGRVVTASAHLPPDLVAAIFSCGAKAVVCAAEHAEPPPDAAAAAFFRSLFGLLGNSVTLLQVCAPCRASALLNMHTFLVHTMVKPA